MGHPVDHRQTEVDGTQLFYLCTGVDQDRPLVLLHGTFWSRVWLPVLPTRLVWGRDDEFQKIGFARRCVEEIPGSDLVELAGKHIPTEDSPREVAEAIIGHLAG